MPIVFIIFGIILVSIFIFLWCDYGLDVIEKILFSFLALITGFLIFLVCCAPVSSSNIDNFNIADEPFEVEEVENVYLNLKENRLVIQKPHIIKEEKVDDESHVEFCESTKDESYIEYYETRWKSETMKNWFGDWLAPTYYRVYLVGG